MKELLLRLVREEDGVTATEYAVMLVLIIVVCLATIIFLGQQVESGFNAVASALSSASAGGGGGGS